jgi:hypothetical protein
MDMNANSSRSPSKRKKRRKRDTDQLAALLAPLEEQDKPAAEHQLGSPANAAAGQSDRHFGAIIVDNEDLKVSADFMEAPQNEKHFLGLEPVVLVVLILMLGFIGFIAWQISLMPAK